MADLCVFCEIVAGRVESSVVHDDDRVLAFMDLNPISPGHLLVIPKEHGAALADVDPDDGARLFRVGQALAAAVRRTGLRAEGVNLFLADGEAAGQEVFHTHLHVLPRFAGDGFRLQLTSASPSRDELDEVAGRIRAAL
jgi:diadenosine tetraphosphate (Ap4A) HIT family hydrolase